MKRFAFIVIAAVVIGCSSTPPPPDWAVNAQGALERSVSAYLAGNTRVAALELDRARAEVARTGAPARVARLELVHCAAEVASATPARVVVRVRILFIAYSRWC